MNSRMTEGDLVEVGSPQWQSAIDEAVLSALTRLSQQNEQARVDAERAAQAQLREQDRARSEADAAVADEASKWEGHTHRYGKPDDDDLRTCRDCGLALPADVIEGADR